MTAALDRCLPLTGDPYAAAWRLIGVSVLRVIADTGTRRAFVYGAGTYTTVPSLRGDGADVFVALAALDVGDTAPATELTTRWADDVRRLAARRPPRESRWLLSRLDLDLRRDLISATEAS